jgi:hypothetical protein
MHGVADWVAQRGPRASQRWSGAANTDDNAYVETRSPRAALTPLKFETVEAPARMAPLPELRGSGTRPGRCALSPGGDCDPWPHAPKLARFLTQLGDSFDPLTASWRASTRAARSEAGADAAEQGPRAGQARRDVPEPRACSSTLRSAATRGAGVEAFTRALVATRPRTPLRRRTRCIRGS